MPKFKPVTTQEISHLAAILDEASFTARDIASRLQVQSYAELVEDEEIMSTLIHISTSASLLLGILHTRTKMRKCREDTQDQLRREMVAAGAKEGIG
jgi:hypothetical protein